MFKEFFGLFVKPVTNGKKIAEKEKLLPVLIKLSIASVIVGLLAMFRAIIMNSVITKESFGFVSMNAGEIIGTLFMAFFLYAGVVALVAVTMMLLSMILKSKVKFLKCLSLVTNYALVIVSVFIVGFIFPIFARPISNLLLAGAFLFFILATSFAFRDMVKVSSVDKQVYMTFLMILAFVAILYLVLFVASLMIPQHIVLQLVNEQLGFSINTAQARITSSATSRLSSYL